MSTPGTAPLAVIAGLGRTGLSCARHLRERGWRIAATDSRATPPGLAEFRALAPDAPLAAGGLDATLLAGAQLVVASPGLALGDPFFGQARLRGVEVVGDIELFARAARAPVLGITGTNGKSTVTTLVGRMAQRAGVRTGTGGNLGPPALELLTTPQPALFVLELSSYQLEATETLALLAAAVLNVTPDHMDRYTDVAAYAAAKARILRRCGTAVVNLDDPLTRDMGAAATARVGFTTEGAPGADWSLEEDSWLACRGERLMPVAELRIAGRHNAANALAALALGEAAGLPRAPMLEELRSFAGLPHRSQWIAEIRGVRYVDDSKGTNVGATLAAVAGMPGTLVLIAGGDGKQQDFTPLARAFAGRVRHAVLIGRDAAALGRVLAGVCPLSYCATLELAVARAAEVAEAGDTVLLSPACASLDMFRDYAQRGDVFARSVRELAS